MDSLCKPLISSGDYQDIMNVLTTVNALNNHLCKLFTCHWSNRGQRLDWLLSKAIHSIVKALEDLLMSAMKGTDVSDLKHEVCCCIR